MSGPAGVGAQRYVKPGESMDYTIYFENATNATAAAIKVAVTLPKDANLDWSTLELGEVVFGDHTDTGFVDDKTTRSIKYTLADSSCEVHTTVTETDSDITWNLRIWDPTTADHFPDDFNKGVLPPNDPDTHCGEGHISFRVCVKNDAVPNNRINASASIVFDDNPAIVTDPAWWNTVSPVDEFLQAGEYFKATLAELGYDVPTDGTPYEVKALGLPAGLQLKYNAAVTKKVKGKTVVVKKAKTEWWIEGVPTAGLDFSTNPPYLVVTTNGVAETYALSLAVTDQEVTDLGELALGQAVNTNGWLAGVGAGWTVSGLPTGLKYATKKVTKTTGSGKKKVTTTVAEAYAVYGTPTKAGLFTITAKKKKGAFYETMKYRVLVRPKEKDEVDKALFGESLTNITTMAYVPVAWDLTEGGSGRLGEAALPGGGALGDRALPVVSNVVKVAGLPTGLTFAAATTYKDKKKTQEKQLGQTIVGTPTKPGTYVVTFTKNVKSGKKTVAKTAQVLWVVEPNDVEVNLGFNTDGGVIENGVVGLNYGELLAFTATSNATVKASGLPAGMKLVRLDGSAGGLALPNGGFIETALPGQAVWGFQGFTTKAGTYLVTVTATLNGKTVTQRLALKVEVLPAWAKGTFNGYVRGSGTLAASGTWGSGTLAASGEEGSGESAASPRGLATVTVSAAGKISGKFYEGGTNWTLSAASYTAATSAAAPAQSGETPLPPGGAQSGETPATPIVGETPVYEAFECTNVVAKYAYKAKEKVKGKWKTVTKYVERTFRLAVSPVPIVPNVPNVPDTTDVPIRGVVQMVEAGEAEAAIEAYQNLWGRTDYKALGKKLFTTKSGKKTLAYKTFTIDVYTNDVGEVTFIKKGDEVKKTGLTYYLDLSLKVTTAGAVTATLTYDTGKTMKDKKTKKMVPVYYKPTCTTVLIPTSAADADPFTGEAFFYFAPSAANNFPGLAGSVEVP